MPDLRKTNDGNSVCRFRLAVRRTFKTNGSYETDFLDIVAWNQVAEFVGRYLCQGQLVSVVASARPRTYENRQKVKVTVVEFVASEINSLASKTPKEEAAEQETSDEQEIFGVNDADLPF